MRLAFRSVAVGCLLLLSAPAFCGSDELIGTKPPEWQISSWLNSAPLKLEDLRGRVLLVRWWTAPYCPYCRATAPSLNEFFGTFHAKGLDVIGIYHHKGEEPLTDAFVRKWSDEYGFKFPVGIDKDWKTLHQWWLDGRHREFTSVTFLIDRKGVIRHIHPGGEYVKGDKDYALMKSRIEELLAEH